MKNWMKCLTTLVFVGFSYVNAQTVTNKPLEHSNGYDQSYAGYNNQIEVYPSNSESTKEPESGTPKANSAKEPVVYAWDVQYKTNPADWPLFDPKIEDAKHVHQTNEKLEVLQVRLHQLRLQVKALRTEMTPDSTITK